MTTHDPHAGPHHVPAADMPFTEAELEELHAQDYKAAVRVVGLMLSIFCVGVVLYTIVVISVVG